VEIGEYGRGTIQYGIESTDFLYQSGEAVTTSVSSPGGMEVSAIVALLAGSSYLGYRKSKNMKQELENTYLDD